MRDRRLVVVPERRRAGELVGRSLGSAAFASIDAGEESGQWAGLVPSVLEGGRPMGRVDVNVNRLSCGVGGASGKVRQGVGRELRSGAVG